MYVSKSQYEHACSIDLAHWLLQNHPNDVKQQYGSVLLRSDPHVSVKHGYHGYRNFKTDETGNNVDYLMNFLNYDYPGAVTALSGDTYNIDCSENMLCTSKLEVKYKDIMLPEPASQYKNLFAYLLKRKIPINVIKLLIDKQLLYQSEKGNNLVFVNPERDYCELRGTNTYADLRCKHWDTCVEYAACEHQWCLKMNECVHYKKNVFHGCRKSSPNRFWYFSDLRISEKSEVVYICESAIDAISLYVLHKINEKQRNLAVYVSIGGAANQSTIERLKQHKRVVLATDNDEAGDNARARNPELETIRPVFKDWNDDLQRGVYYDR